MHITKQSHPPHNKLTQQGIAHLFALLFVIVLFAVVGTYFIVRSRAATTITGVTKNEAEKMTSSTTKNYARSDTSASGGAVLKMTTQAQLQLALQAVLLATSWTLKPRVNSVMVPLTWYLVLTAKKLAHGMFPLRRSKITAGS